MIFIWKGKDKAKRSSLISDVEHGGLKAPHYESIIKKQIMCCKTFANGQLSAWKTFLLLYLKPIGGKLILCCDFNLEKTSTYSSLVLKRMFRMLRRVLGN